MNLPQIIALSSLISIGTLILLMIQRRKPSLFRYPGWYLGGTAQLQNSIPKLTWPPLLSLLALLAFTLGAGLVFRPELLTPPSASQQSDHIVWIDPTFSAHLSRIQNNFDAAKMASKIVEESTAWTWIGLELFYDQKLSWRWKTLSDKSALQSFITEQSRFVLPHAVPFQPDSWDGLQKELAQLSQNPRVLHVVSDGQAETLRGLSPLSNSIQGAVLQSTGEVKKYTGERQEIIPESTRLAWEGGKETVSTWVKLSTDSTVPTQARPGVAVEFFENTGNTFSLGSAGGSVSTSFVSSLLNSSAPLVTICGNSLGAVQELDPTADLRALLEFLKVPTRLQSCLDPSISKSEATNSKDLWRNRNQSLWVVPLTEEVIGSLFLKSEFWYPLGFDPCCDFIVYTAPLNTSDAAFSERIPVQMDPGASPVPIQLAAEPPATSLKIGPESAATDGFIPYFESVDGIKLAYKSMAARAFYLRTGLGMPAGELGRSGTWSQIWIGFLKSASVLASPSFKRLAPFDLSEWQGESVAFLDPIALSFSPAGFTKDGAKKNEADSNFYLGLLKDPAILIETHSSERTRSLLSTAEVEAIFKPMEEPKAASEKLPEQKAWKSPLVQIGLVLVALALIFFWTTKKHSRAAASFSEASKIVLLLLALLVSFSSRISFAQNFEIPLFSRKQSSTQLANTPNIPFRIGWCDAEIPDKVRTQYTQLREILASRGTIELPSALKPGACTAGSSEIWWATAQSALSTDETLRHIQYGGLIVVEGVDKIPKELLGLENSQVGLRWQKQQRRGLLYRSFYLLQSIDHCLGENTWMLNLRKKLNANAPIIIATNASFFEDRADCMAGNTEKKERSFVNIMYALLTSDYKEDQMQLPEILGRIRSLGLEP